jgi:MSHA pilin protein MshC
MMQARSESCSWPGGRRFPRRPAGIADLGFTLVEVVVVLVVVGILAVVAIPRFSDRSAFDQRGFLDQTRSAIQFARKSAVAQRRRVCVAIGAGGLSITALTCGGAPLTNPATGGAFVLAAPSGATLSPPVNLVFDALGRLASPDVQTAIAVTGVATPIVVERETGYVH